MSRPARSESFAVQDNRILAPAPVAAYACLVLVVTLAPFDFTLSRITDLQDAWSAVKANADVHPPDVLANIALYVPLGIFGWLLGKKRAIPRIVSSFRILAFAVLLSATCEMLQVLLPLRVPTLVDVVANIMGCFVGLLIAPGLRAWIRRFRRSSSSKGIARPWSLAFNAVACGLLIALWWPLDAALTGPHLARLARQMSLDPMHEWQTLGESISLYDDYSPAFEASYVRRERIDYLLTITATAVGFAVLSALGLAAMRREYGFRRGEATLLALWTCLFIGALATAGRGMLVSRGLDTMMFGASFAGGLLGIAALRLTRTDGLAMVAAEPRIKYLRALAPALAVGYFVIRETAPFDFGGARGIGRLPQDFTVFHWTPIASYVQTRANLAALDLSSKVFAAGLVGAAAACCLNVDRHWRRPAFAAALLVGGFSLVMQYVHLNMPSRRSDITNPILAALGAAAGVWIAALISTILARRARTTDVAVANRQAATFDRALVDAIANAGGEAPREGVDHVAAAPARSPSSNPNGPTASASGPTTDTPQDLE
ncbi:MAG: VanZ family protein [Phycisphaerae bacterium]